ncbi:MAG: DeoR/GlpR family DNA-binding transcription regulator [Sediminibacterium sp.]
MNKHERLKEILDYLDNHKELSVTEACIIFNSSAATIRRDFIYLFKKNKAQKTWGGITKTKLIPSIESMGFVEERKVRNIELKSSIAEYAASLVQDGDVIILDGGTTILQMIPFLKNKKIKIITNSLLIANRIDEITEGFEFELFVTGGFVYPRSGMLVGSQVSNSINDFNSKWFIMSVGGISKEGLFNSNALIVDTEKDMIKRSEKFIVLADHTKIGKRDSVKLCNLETPDLIITDAGFLDLEPELKDILKLSSLHIVE